jgi:hypothetical protein
VIQKLSDAANATINALRETPVLLSLVLFQGVFVAAVVYLAQESQKASRHRFDALAMIVQQCISDRSK